VFLDICNGRLTNTHGIFQNWNSCLKKTMCLLRIATTNLQILMVFVKVEIASLKKTMRICKFVAADLKKHMVFFKVRISTLKKTMRICRFVVAIVKKHMVFSRSKFQL